MVCGKSSENEKEGRDWTFIRSNHLPVTIDTFYFIHQISLKRKKYYISHFKDQKIDPPLSNWVIDLFQENKEDSEQEQHLIVGISKGSL